MPSCVAVVFEKSALSERRAGTKENLLAKREAVTRLSSSATGRAAAFRGYRRCPHPIAPAEFAAGKPPHAYSKRENKRKMLFRSNAIT